MLDIKLLNGAENFWSDLKSAISTARQRVLLQAMTFEADSVGRAVERAIATSPALDRKVLVDAYSFAVINDRFVHAPWNWHNRRLQCEARDTSVMFTELQAQGVQVRVTNPIGLLMQRYPARNHKKLMVVDDSVWFGGINFSEHNFAWRDFMVRIDDPAVADFLAADFTQTFDGTPLARHSRFGSVEILTLDGKHNARSFDVVKALIKEAKLRIVVLSPYLTAPIADWLAQASYRGVEVEIFTPQANNKPLLKSYLRSKLSGTGCRIVETEGMIHAKCMVIDDQTVVTGSSNFDFVSLQLEEEILVVMHDRKLACEIENTIFAEFRQFSSEDTVSTNPKLSDIKARVAIGVASAFLGVFRHVRRGSVLPEDR